MRALPPRVQVLYLGGNLLQTLNDAVCALERLNLLYLGGNRLKKLPAKLAQLTRLRTLNLHDNQLTALPPGIVEMKSLRQLSLRGNPLVTDFVEDMKPEPLSLMELCAREIKRINLRYCSKCLPAELCRYLDSGKCCSNPDCRGVYFTQGVRTVDFVDVCGKYRVPLMKYLCSHGCEETVRPPVPDAVALGHAAVHGLSVCRLLECGPAAASAAGGAGGGGGLCLCFPTATRTTNALPCASHGLPGRLQRDGGWERLPARCPRRARRARWARGPHGDTDRLRDPKDNRGPC
jgi:hypothetical protein